MTVRLHEDLAYKSVRGTNGHGPLREAPTDALAENGPPVLRRPKANRGSSGSFEIRRQKVGTTVLDLVAVVAVLAEERAFQDFVLLDVHAELQVPFAHGTAQDLHEVSLHRPPEGRRPTYAHRARAFGLRSKRLLAGTCSG